MLGDIGSQLDNIGKTKGGWLDNFLHGSEKVGSFSRELETLSSELERADTAAKKLTIGKIMEITQQSLKKARVESSKLYISLKAGSEAFDAFGKSIIGVGLAGFTLGMQQLSKGVYKVYDLFERWTKVMGEFNMKVGSASNNMKSAQRFGLAWEGTIRGLTDQMGAGMQMAGDFIESFDRMPFDTKEKEGSRFAKTMLGLARGFNLGGEGAGKFADMMQRLSVTGVMSDQPKEAAEQYKQMNDAAMDMFKDSVAAAKAANVPVNKFFKDIVQSKDFFAEVGESGRKGLTTAIGFVKKLGVSVQGLKKFMDGFDTFDNTATNIAKLNTVFGSSIDSMQVMLEQDPGKRFEIVRQGLLSQGKTFDQLSRMERKIIAETTNLSVEEVNAMLKSGKSLEDFEKDQEKAREKKLKSETMIRDALQKTATTMFAFGAAWDRVTVAIIKLIKPFTDLVGLTNSGEKGAKSFSGVMDGLFKRLIKFIDEVAANKDWQTFMKNLANDAKSLATRISEIATGPGLTTWINSVVKAGTDFYDIMKMAFGVLVKVGKEAMPIVKFIADNIKPILALWAVNKVAGGAIALAPGMAAMGALPGLGAGLGAGVAGAGVGAAVGHAAGATTGGAAGGGIGAALGMAAGPLGAAIGGVVGTTIGIILEKHLTSGTTKERKEVEERLSKILKVRTVDEEIYATQQRRRAEKDQETNTIVDSLNKGMATATGAVATYSDKEKDSLIERIKGFQKLGLSSEEMNDMLQKLSNPSNGQLYFTGEQIKQLSEKSKEYTDTINKLNDETSKYLQAQKAKLADEVQYNELKIKKEKLTNEDLIKAKMDAEDEANRKRSFWEKLNGTKRLEKLGEIAKLEKDLKEESERKFLVLKKDQFKKEVEISERAILAHSDAFKSFRVVEANKGLSFEEALVKFANSETGKDIIGSGSKSPPQRAAGGIAMSPQSAIIGEAGPEAIIPLKSLISGGDSLSANTVGAQVANNVVNLADRNRGGGGGGDRSISTEVVVNIDSTTLGRTIVRKLLSEYD